MGKHDAHMLYLSFFGPLNNLSSTSSANLQDLFHFLTAGERIQFSYNICQEHY